MYDSTIERDFVKSEVEYRRSRIRDGIVGRRQRRAMARRADSYTPYHTAPR